MFLKKKIENKSPFRYDVEPVLKYRFEERTISKRKPPSVF